MVDTSDGLQDVNHERNLCRRFAYLREDVANFEDLQLWAPRLVLGLVNGVGDNDLVQCTGVDAINGISTENAVSDQRIHLRRALLLHQLSSTSDSVRCVCQIIDEDGSAVCNITDQHHGRILPVADLGGSALLVDQRKRHTERISDGSGSLSTSGVGTDNDSLLVVGDVRLDVLAEEMAAVQVIDWNVEEALVLGIYQSVSMELLSGSELRTVQIHGNDMVGASTCEEVGNQRAGLSNPLTVADLWLESWGLGGPLCDYTIHTITTVKVHRVLRLVRVDCLGATDAVRLHRAGGIRGAVALLVELHATELVVQCRGAIGAQTRALRLARVRCLGARLKAVCACPRPCARDPGERCAGLVVGDV